MTKDPIHFVGKCAERDCGGDIKSKDGGNTWRHEIGQNRGQRPHQARPSGTITQV